MHPLQNGSQAEQRPASKPLTGLAGWFTESGENNVPSYPGADWFNHNIAEFKNLLDSQGIVFDPSREDHLKQVIQYIAYHQFGSDQLTRQLAVDINGKNSFIDDGFKVVPRGAINTFGVLPGAAYVGGLRVELDEEQIVTTESYPKNVYVDAYFDGDVSNVWETKQTLIITDDVLDDYIDNNGTAHYVVKIAIITASNQVEDLRSYFGVVKQLKVINDDDSYLSSSYATEVYGRTKTERNESEVSSNRPVAWSYQFHISPPTKPNQTTDFHGMDIYGDVGESSNSLDLSNVRNYLFESKASYTGSGKLAANYGGFFEANNYGPGDLGRAVALRLWARNQGIGNVGSLYGIDITAPINNGSVTDSYGIYIGDFRVGSGNNYALFSEGGDVRFDNGDLFSGGSISLPYKSDDSNRLIQKVSGFSGEITLLSVDGCTAFNLNYTFPDPNSLAYKFKLNETTIMSITSEGKINAKSINFSNIPTSSAGLSVGDVWSDGGILKIVE
ncbi:hypothetical protein [Shewanella sp. MSW]|uniref:hypothetical protein n=1 Tax=Shewanella sp. MSW TaxID=2569536 RepID=UPI0016427FB4|nr:hypothetical protein [Shewanella sp. MSW]TVP12546.1 hypothetical protein AYI96_05825 [Shewanella sp. MSW]